MVSNFIYQCISTVQYSLLLNGGFCPSFIPSRGLRQGDLLSPYLFIIGSKILTRLVNREVSRNNLSAFKVSNLAPPISKLCYADDAILFCKAKIVELVTLKNVWKIIVPSRGKVLVWRNLVSSLLKGLVDNFSIVLNVVGASMLFSKAPLTWVFHCICPRTGLMISNSLKISWRTSLVVGRAKTFLGQVEQP